MNDIFRQSTKTKETTTTNQQSTMKPLQSTSTRSSSKLIKFTDSLKKTNATTIKKLTTTISTPSFIIDESGEITVAPSNGTLIYLHTDKVSSPKQVFTTLSATSTFMPESEYNTPTRVSLFTLTALLGCIYGLAFILAVVWVIWLYLRRKTLKALKRSQVDSREFCSINAIS